MARSQNQRTYSTRRQRRREQSPPARKALRSDQHGSRSAAARTASLQECRAELQDNHFARTREVLAYRDKALALIEALKESCRELLCREEACLNRLECLSPTPSELIPFHTALQDLRRPIPERLVFSKNGMIVSFMPEQEENENETVESELQVDTTACHTLPAMASPSIKPAPPRSPPPANSASRTHHSGPSSTLQTVSSQRACFSKRKRLIRPREVKVGNYWVFEHGRRAGQPNMYILRCPKKSCQQPVFSRHPLKENRAVSHFKACKVRFKNLHDLVSRYADLVVPDRPSRPVTRKWAKEHNEKLIGKNEDFLRAENVWPSISELEMDELEMDELN